MDRRLAKVNYEYCTETLSLKNRLELSYLELAERLHKIQLNKMYLPNYDTFEDFCTEMKISLATASKLINIWLRFVIKFKIAPKMLAEAGGWSVVAELLPYAESRTSAERWLRQAKANTRTDLRKSLLEVKTGIDMSTCKHAREEVITFKKCLDCGETHRIYDDEKRLEKNK